MTSTFFIIEASHLFRAGELFSAQLYVVDVIRYLAREIFNTQSAGSWVLFGSTKDSQAEKYTAAVEKTGTTVIRMTAIDSRLNIGSKFYKPASYLHEIFKDLPIGSQIVLIGFHNTRFEDILLKYKNRFSISMCAFTTKSKNGMDMKIPDHFGPLLHKAVSLDNHIDGIKGEYERHRVMVDEAV
jgi:CTP:phosphocholine cytidylyltransferase-like protein